MTTVEVLRKAKAELQRRGWCQGITEDAPRVCLMGALNVASWGRARWDGETSAAALDDRDRAAAAIRSVTGCSPVRWNDRDGRTLEEVLNAFDQAIAEASPSRGDGGR